LEPDLREPLKENALRLGNMDIVSVTMRQLKEQYIGTNPELVQKSRDKTYTSICWRDEYLTLSTDEKIKKVKLLKVALKDTLDCLSRQSTR
jgi:hypothetical protein